MSIDFQGVVRQVDLAQKAAPELEKLKKATEAFEAIFLKKLFSQMRASVKETQFGQSFGKEIYNDMFNEALANSAAKSKTLGMGDMLYNQFAPTVMNGIATQQMRNQAYEVAARQKLELKPTDTLPSANPDLIGPITHDGSGHAISRKP
jgi:Rod binding domain-containing protein